MAGVILGVGMIPHVRTAGPLMMKEGFVWRQGQVYAHGLKRIPPKATTIWLDM